MWYNMKYMMCSWQRGENASPNTTYKLNYWFVLNFFFYFHCVGNLGTWPSLFQRRAVRDFNQTFLSLEIPLGNMMKTVLNHKIIKL